MANTADLIRTGASKMTSGEQVTSNSLDTDNSGSESSGVVEDGTTSVSAGESTDFDILPGSEDAQTDSSSTSGKKEAATSSKAKPVEVPKISGNTEVITITDDKGRRTVEIDWDNKDQLKKHVQMAYGSRKWQAERDAAIKTAKQTSEKVQELQSNWDTLNGVYAKDGLKGLVDLIEGKKGAYDEHVKQQVARAKYLERATPEEKDALEAKELALSHARELERIRKENDEFKVKMTEERDTADLRSLESKVHPIFEKYRFADRLGDAEDEHLFDEMLWNSALKRLEPYEEEGLDITPELLDREFKAVATTLRKRINVQAEKKAGRAIAQRKQEATENVQSKVKSGYTTGGTAKEARDLINSGNLNTLLKGWGKYGSLFKGK